MPSERSWLKGNRHFLHEAGALALEPAREAALARRRDHRTCACRVIGRSELFQPCVGLRWSEFCSYRRSFMRLSLQWQAPSAHLYIDCVESEWQGHIYGHLRVDHSAQSGHFGGLARAVWVSGGVLRGRILPEADGVLNTVEYPLRSPPDLLFFFSCAIWR